MKNTKQFASKKLLTLAIAVLMTATTLPGVALAAEGEVPPFAMPSFETPAMTTTPETESVEAIKVGEADAFVYIPASDLLGRRASSSPVMLVFGDTAYTLETALETAHASGLGEIAATEGTVVMFMNPVGDTWSATDAPLYTAALGMFSGSSTDVFTNGKTVMNAYPGAVEGRIYVYGEGRGANFIAENLMDKVENKVTFPDGFSMVFDRTPTSYMLFNPTVIPAVADIGIELPTAVVNAPAGFEASIAAMNSVNGIYAAQTSEITAGFDAALVKSLFDAGVGRTTRQQSVIVEIPDYAALDIKVERKFFTLGDKQMEYYEYIPASVGNAATGSVPLLLGFHGGGNTAELFAWQSGWPLIMNGEGGVTACVQDHTSYTATELKAFAEYMMSQYPAIDKTRVYASGFSMGSISSFSLGLQYPELLAGIAPFDALNISMVGVSTAPDTIIPTFYVGGEVSPLPEFPSQGEESANMIKLLLQTNKVTDNYAYNAEADKAWGIAANSVYTIPNTKFPGNNAVVSLLASKDGNVYTAFEFSTLKSHETYGNDAVVAWDFLKRFTRNEDGSITISDTQKYIDIYANHTFYDAIEYVSENGMMNDIGGGLFAADQTLTRAMVANILYQLAGKPTAAVAASFSDVPAGQWYTDAIGWATANKIVYGIDGEHFGTNHIITHQDLMTILYRYAASRGDDVSGATSLTLFADSRNVAGYAVSAMEWAIASGIINGDANGLLDPTGAMTRGETAEILYRFAK